MPPAEFALSPLIMVLLGCLWASIAWAQNPGGSPIPPYRCLFVVDTSYSMGRRVEATSQTVSNLIATGLQGQMRPGDLYGLWTFSTQVWTNYFMPMPWDDKLNEALGNGAARYLRAHPYANLSRINKLWDELIATAKDRDSMTVILLSDGDDTVRGTPFDEPLNRIYKQHARALRRERKPFMTTLVLYRGRFVAYTVNAPGESIDFNGLFTQALLAGMPPPDRELNITNALTNALTNTVLTTTPPGSPPDQTSDTVPRDSILASTVATNQFSSSVPILVDNPKLMEPPPIQVEDVKTNLHVNPAPVVTAESSIPVADPSPTNTTQEVVIPAPEISSVVTNPPVAITNAPLPQMTDPVATQPPVIAQESNPPPPESSLTNETTKVAAQTLPEVVPTAPVPTNEVARVHPVTEETNAVPSLIESIPAIPLAPSAPVAVAKPKPPLNQYLWWGLGLGCLVSGLGLVTWMRRRGRRAPQASFISRGIERQLR